MCNREAEAVHGGAEAVAFRGGGMDSAATIVPGFAPSRVA